MSVEMTKEIIDRIFKEPGVKYELTEFDALGKPIHEILSIEARTADTGRDAGKTKYFLKSVVPFSSGKEDVQVYVEGGKSAPEEIVRQLWLYKLIYQYGYQSDEIDLEKSVHFGTKGDVVDNDRFLEVAKVQPFRLLQGGQSLPINPFILPAYDGQTINVSAREKAESFASINSKLGVVQKGALTEAIRAAYAQRAENVSPYPDFNDVYQIVAAMYEEDNKRDDSLIEVLRDLADFDLFWRHGSDIPPIDRLSNRTILIDVHAMPVLKELVAYLVIERLYKEMALLPDSPVKEGHRTIRNILVIDEAHNYLSQKNIFLQRIIREGRSKGIVVFFASQSPNDYQQKFFNFQELLEFAFIFQCEGVAAGSVQDILGCSNRTAKDLQTEIARLEPWQVVARSPEKTEEFVKFTAEAFYKNY